MFRFIFRLLFGASVAASTAYLAIRADNLQTKGPTPVLVWITASLLGLAALADILGVIVERVRSDRSAAFYRQVDNRLRSMWFAILMNVKTLKTMMPVGAHVWLVPKWHWKIVPYRLRSVLPEDVRSRLPAPPMWRPTEFRPVDETISSNIYWRRGKGVIGQCWRERSVIYWDYEERWGKDLLTEEQWLSLPKETRLGLKYSEYTKLRQSYGQVLAVPVFKEVPRLGHTFVIGCVVVDTPPNWRAKVDLNDPELKTIVRAAAVDASEIVA